MFFLGIYLILFTYRIEGTRGSEECAHPQLSATLHQLASNHTHITRLLSIGKSVQGREIWVMILSDKPEMRPLLRPQVKLVGNINGFSGPACYLLLRLVQNLAKGYEIEGSLERKLLETNEIHVIFNMNPDGFAGAKLNSCDASQGRLNRNMHELNRDFPYLFEEDERTRREPETEAMMRWTEENSFILSLSLISGAFVVTYPFDSIPQQEEQVMEPAEHLTPDDDIFHHLALTYVQNIPGDPWHCPSLERLFPQGIVNGAAWKPAKGTMMDYNYSKGTFELMIGVSCCRNPKEQDLPFIWEQHGQALMRMIEETKFGVRGQVVDAETGEVLPDAQLSTSDDGPPWFSSAQGEFWKPLLPGRHSVKVTKEGYIDRELLFDVNIKEGTILEVRLKKLYSPPPTTEFKIELSPETAQPFSVTSKHRIFDTSKSESRNGTRTFDQTLVSMLARLTSSCSLNGMDLSLILSLATVLLGPLQ